eukprot:4306291-Pyramimonas_sp.AAC.1
MKQDMYECQRMKQSSPNRTYEWFRQRVLDDLEMKQLEKNQNKLRYESENRSQGNICAAWKKDNCQNGDRCKALRTCPKDSRDGRSSRTSQAGGNARRSPSVPASTRQKPGAKFFCFEFAKHSSCARGD